MAHKSTVRIFVVRYIFKGSKQFAQCCNNAVSLLVFNHTDIDRDKAVCAFRISSGHNAFPLVKTDNGMHFVAVKCRTIHTVYFSNGADPFKKLF